MSRLGGAALLAAIAVLLAGCTSAQDVGAPDPQLRGQWELQAAKDAGGTLALANQRITLTIDGDGTTTGRSTCADYTARLLGTAARLWVTAALPKKRYCPTSIQQELEIRYIQDLRSVRYATVTNGTMTLRAPGVSLNFERALHIPLTLVTNRTWNVETVGQDNSAVGGFYLDVYAKGAWIRLSDRGNLTGSDACRTFSGRWIENAGEIVVTDFGSARMAPCTQNNLLVDGYLTGLLTESFTWQSSNGLLSLNSPRGGVIASLTEHHNKPGECTECESTN